MLGSFSGLARWRQIDASGDGYFISYPSEGRVLASTLRGGAAGERLVLRTGAPVSSFWLDGNSEQIAVLDETGALRVGSLAHASEPRQLTGSLLRPEEVVNGVAFDAVGRWLAAAFERQGLRMWDLTGPPDAEPIGLGRGAVTATIAAVFDRTGRWLVTENLGGVTFWPSTGRWPSVFRVSADQPRDVAFDPDGKWIAAASRKGGVEIWPSTANGLPRRRLAPGMQVSQLAVSPDGQFLAMGTRSGSVLVLPVAGSGVRELRGFQGSRGLGGLRCHGKANRC